MKLFVSTKETQGNRHNDFCWVEEDEILYFGMTCDNGFTDDGCGCHRAMAGVMCHKATTTAKVVDRPELTTQDLADIIHVYAGRPNNEALNMAKIIRQEASKFNVGDVVEFRDGKFSRRL